MPLGAPTSPARFLASRSSQARTAAPSTAPVLRPRVVAWAQAGAASSYGSVAALPPPALLRPIHDAPAFLSFSYAALPLLHLASSALLAFCAPP